MNGSVAQLTGGNTTFRFCDFKNNKASENGGAISLTSGSVWLSGCQFSSNVAGGNGQAISVTGPTSAIYFETCFWAKTAGKIIYLENGASMVLSGLYSDGNGTIVVDVKH